MQYIRKNLDPQKQLLLNVIGELIKEKRHLQNKGILLFSYEYDRHSKREKRSKNEIGIHSIRGGTEAGKHSVIFFGNNESLEITHNVTSRSVFADGAIKAANFIIHKDNGLYSMNDLCI